MTKLQQYATDEVDHQPRHRAADRRYQLVLSDVDGRNAQVAGSATWQTVKAAFDLIVRSPQFGAWGGTRRARILEVAR